MNITSAVWGVGIIASSASAIGRVPARQLHSLTRRDVNHVGIALAWATLVSVLEFGFCLFVYSIFCQCPFSGTFTPLLQSCVV